MKLASLSLTWISSLVLLLFVFPLKSFGKEDAPVIEISTGKIKGEEKESREDKVYFAYRGIPYATPPKGPLRFLPPEPPANWSGVKETEDFQKECLHWDPYDKKVEGSEDCLYLNVYTPKIGDGIGKKLLPVLVYIGGGFFMSGSSNHYKPHYFMDSEIIVVTLNFRTGVLGFLNVDGVVQGNMGLKDQNMALRWVQKNIRKFAGDPSHVTIFGDGIGGASVHFHLLSPLSKGLFHQAVSISGTAISSYSFQPRPFQAARRLAKNLNCHEKLNATSLGIDNSTVLVDCLRKIEGKKLVEIEKETLSPLRDPLSLFLPSVESSGNESDKFLSEHPYGIMSSGRQLKVPFILGINSEEGLLVTAQIQNNKQLLDIVENQWKEFSPNFLLYDKTRRDITEQIRKFYIDRNILASVGTSYDMTTTTTTPTISILPTSSSRGVKGNNYTHIYPTFSPNLQVLPTSKSNTLVNQSPLSPITSAPNILPINGTVSTYKLESFENTMINFEEKFSMFTRLFTDRFFTAPLVEVAKIQSKYSPVYLYYNKYQGQFSFADVYSGKEKEPTPALKRVSSWFKTKVLGRTTQPPRHLGVCHGDMIPLLFKYYDAKVKEDTKDFAMSKDIVNLFVKFAYKTPKMEFRNVTWLAVDPNLNGTLNALQISNTEKENVMLFDVFRETGDFWKSLKYLAPFQQ